MMDLLTKGNLVKDNTHLVYEAGQYSTIDKTFLNPNHLSGTHISIKDASIIKHDIKCKVSGDNIDMSTVRISKFGKNLIPYPFSGFTKSSNGITATDLGDGGVLLNGTATSEAYIHLHMTNIGSRYISGIYGKNGIFFANKYNENIWVEHHNTNHLTYIVISAGTVCDNIVFYPQIEVGTVETEFEKGIPYETFTPNDDGMVEGMTNTSQHINLFSNTEGVTLDVEYMQYSMVDESKLVPKTVSGELISLNDVSELRHKIQCKASSKNLANLNQVPWRIFRANIVEQTYDTLKLETTVNGAKWTGVYYELPESLIGKTLTLSGTWEMSNPNSQGALRIQWLSDANTPLGAMLCYTSQSGAVKTFTVSEKPEGATKLALIVYAVADSTNAVAGDTVTYKNIQLEKGAAVTAFTPYVDVNTATLSALGKNLINADDFINAQFVKNEDGSYTLTKGEKHNRFSNLVKINFPAGIKITVSIPNYQGTAASFEIQVLYEDGTYATLGSLNSGKKSISYTVTKRITGLRLYLSEARLVGEYVTIGSFQIELGPEATEYEPYIEASYPISADGRVENVKSISPYMNIFTNTDGVIIDVTYNKSYGMQTEYDRFWDAFQMNGKRTGYVFGFAGEWNKDIFYPKYDIITSDNVNQMFYQFGLNSQVGGNNTLNLIERAKECGITISFGKLMYATYMFYYAKISHIPTLDLTNHANKSVATILNNARYTKYIEKIIVSEELKYQNGAFQNMLVLEEVRFEGVIGNSIAFAESEKLSHDSLMSIINALKDYSTDTSGTAHTLTISTTNIAKLTDEEKAIATAKGWTLA